MMGAYVPAAKYLLWAVLAGAGVLILISFFKEWRQAAREDDKEKSARHIRRKLLEYSIIVVVCVVAFFGVRALRSGPLQGVSEALWGTRPTVTPNPFTNPGPELWP